MKAEEIKNMINTLQQAWELNAKAMEYMDINSKKLDQLCESNKLIQKVRNELKLSTKEQEGEGEKKWVIAQDVKLLTWLDQFQLNENSEIYGRIVKHSGGIWGDVALRSDKGNFAIKLENQQKAIKNVGKSIKAKPYPPSYGTVEILEYL